MSRMQDELTWEVRIPSGSYDRVREAKTGQRFSGRVELRRVVPEGLWDLIAIVDCENEADADLVAQLGNTEP